MKTPTVLLFLGVLFIEVYAEGSLFDKFSSGFKLAGKLLGIDHVSEISQLISNAFSAKKSQEETKGENENIFSGFLRILGFDSKKVAAIGVNGIIFIAQLISSSLTKSSSNETPEELKNEEDTLTWISSVPSLQHIVEHSKNSDLPQFLIEYIKERSLDENTGCIQLLICKLSPFVKKMQNYLKNPEKNAGKAALYKHLPSIEEIEDIGNVCEEKHPYCRIIY